MRYLILSDIHSNWEALQAVLARAEGSYDQIACCGDLVGYGPDPNPVVDWVRQNVASVIRGNHDKAAVGLESLEWFNPIARAAALWTMRELTPENRDYVRMLRKGPLLLEGFQLVHGSPLDEDEYLIGTASAANAFPYVESELTFFGHTHLQGGFVWSANRMMMIARPKAREEMAFQLSPDVLYLINPGSVGQPRDGDWRSAYVVYDEENQLVTYYREPYDVAGVQDKIRRAGLPDALADRLGAGH